MWNTNTWMFLTMFLAWIVGKYSKERMHTRNTGKWSILNSFEIIVLFKWILWFNSTQTRRHIYSWHQILEVLGVRPGLASCVENSPAIWLMGRDMLNLSIWKLVKMPNVQFVVRGSEENNIWTGTWKLCTVIIIVPSIIFNKCYFKRKQKIIIHWFVSRMLLFLEAINT